MNNLPEESLRGFAEKLSSKEPVPGGGGASALVGALGVALNTMAANFSIGKKKLLEYEDEHKKIIEKGEMLRNKLLDLIDEDAKGFEPLSCAYGLPSTTDEEKLEKQRVMQECLKTAVLPPIEIMECIFEGILLHERLVDISSKLIVSDIGVGVSELRAALSGAYINVLVNLNSITDAEYSSKIREKVDNLFTVGIHKSDEVYKKVIRRI